MSRQMKQIFTSMAAALALTVSASAVSEVNQLTAGEGLKVSSGKSLQIKMLKESVKANSELKERMSGKQRAKEANLYEVNKDAKGRGNANEKTCTTFTITSGTYGGTLDSSCSSPRNAGSYAEFWDFWGNDGDMVEIWMDSTAVDAYLYILGSPMGSSLAWDDDSGTGATNAYLGPAYLNTGGGTGQYGIEATSFYAGETGPYTLTLSLNGGGGGGGGCFASVFPGDLDFCRDCGPCFDGEGDCDNDGECVAGTTCVANVGGSYGWGSTVDVCESSGGGGGCFSSIFPGDFDFCRDCGPCYDGEGDCDNDGECIAGTTCVSNVGGSYGWGSSVDVCESSGGGSGCFISSFPGDWNFCTVCGPCYDGEGDCDGDSECDTGLFCNSDVGASYGWSSAMDVCESATCPATTACSVPNGHSTYCTVCGPCDWGTGDCDSNSQCRSGLVCGVNNGADWGMHSSFDVCIL